MIIYTQNEDELITSFFEFDIVNADGKRSETGEYLYVRHLWIHKSLNGVQTMIDYKQKILEHPLCQNFKYFYWNREKRHRLSRLFKKETQVKKLGLVFSQ